MTGCAVLQHRGRTRRVDGIMKNAFAMDAMRIITSGYDFQRGSCLGDFADETAIITGALRTLG